MSSQKEDNTETAQRGEGSLVRPLQVSTDSCIGGAPAPQMGRRTVSGWVSFFFLFALTASTSCATLLALVLIRESFGVANDTMPMATSAQGGASAMTPPKKQEKRKEALRQRAKENRRRDSYGKDPLRDQAMHANSDEVAGVVNGRSGHAHVFGRRSCWCGSWQIRPCT